MRRRCEQVLDVAWAGGVRYVDAARSYGRAEEFLAGWLEAHPERRPTVASKWGYRYVGDWSMDASVHEIKDHGAAALEEQWAQTSVLLGGQLDLYQLHSFTPESRALQDPAVLSRLAEIRDSGVGVGVSVSGPNQAAAVRAAVAVEVGGRPLVCSVQATWNVLERSVALALAEAAQAGLLVVVKEAMANGRLTGAEAPKSLHRLAAAEAESPDTLALLAALAQPWAGVVLSGAVSVDQIRRNLQALRLRAERPELAQAVLRAVAAVEPRRYWSERAVRPWL